MLPAMLASSLPGHFEGEVLKIEYRDGTEPMFLRWFEGAWTQLLESAVLEQWQAQLEGVEVPGHGVVRYEPLLLATPLPV